MEIEVGEYVRTRGFIGKLIRIEFDKIDTSLKWYVLDTNKKQELFVNKPYIEKHSKNIVDLIEVGDYVNGYKVISIDYDVIDDKTECIELDLNNNYQHNFISARQIKTIVTKEQMANIEYKVEGEI